MEDSSSSTSSSECYAFIFMVNCLLIIQIYRAALKNYQIGRRIPHCGFELELLSAQVQRLCHKVVIKGLPSPNSFHIRYPQPEGNKPLTTCSYITLCSFYSAPDTSSSAPDTSISAPDTSISAPDTRISAPDTRSGAPDTRISAPDTRISAPDTSSSAPDTSSGAPDTSSSAPDTSSSASVSR